MIYELVGLLLFFALAWWLARRLGWPDIVQTVLVVVFVVYLVLALVRGPFFF